MVVRSQDNWEFGPVFLFALLTGARREEIHLARVGDVRLGDNVVLLRNDKTATTSRDSFRALQIHPDLRKILEDRVADRAPGDPLFPEMAQHSRNWPQNQMVSACKATGTTYRRFHSLRHTFVTYLLRGGVDIRTAMAAAGHKKLETTQIYAGLAEAAADTSKLDL